jgi:hypothetical protein
VTGRGDITEERLRQVRLGHGANCSSIGSVVDTLFATATVGAAIFAAIVAALATEPVRVVQPAREENDSKGTGDP